jgi:hypothetical protein
MHIERIVPFLLRSRVREPLRNPARSSEFEASKASMKVDDLTVPSERHIKSVKRHSRQTSGLKRICFYMARLNFAWMAWHALPKAAHRLITITLELRRQQLMTSKTEGVKRSAMWPRFYAVE